MQKQMEESDPPEGMPSGELIVLHDPDSESALVVMLFESDADYEKADAIMDAMPAEDTPGKRASVKKHRVVARMKS